MALKKLIIVGLLFLILLTIVSAKKCKFNKKKYGEGKVIKKICANIVCSNGQWKFLGWNGNPEKCARCGISNDPHFTTFDGYYYDFHGICNYSLAQKGYGYNSKFGIYGQFYRCYSFPSCVDITTFKNNKKTVVEVHHNSIPNVFVNGSPFTVPNTIVGVPSSNNKMLAWYDGYCVHFVGHKRLVLTACPYYMYIYAHRKLKNKINGLCGHFNFDMADDFTTRSKAVLPLQSNPIVFPTSWMTADQSKNCPDVEKPDEDTNESYCGLNDDDLEILRARCGTLFAGNVGTRELFEAAVRDCVSDLCMMIENNVPQVEQQAWMVTMQEMQDSRVEIEKNTIGEVIITQTDKATATTTAATPSPTTSEATTPTTILWDTTSWWWGDTTSAWWWTRWTRTARPTTTYPCRLTADEFRLVPQNCYLKSTAKERNAQKLSALEYNNCLSQYCRLKQDGLSEEELRAWIEKLPHMENSRAKENTD